MASKQLRRVSAGQVAIFKIKNRRGYAAVCAGNLTEGRTPAQAFARLLYPLRRMGLALPERMPAVRRSV